MSADTPDVGRIPYPNGHTHPSFMECGERCPKFESADTPDVLTAGEAYYRVKLTAAERALHGRIDGQARLYYEKAVERIVAARVAAHCENCATTDQWRDQKARADAAEAKIAAVAALAAGAPYSTPIVSVHDLRAALGGEATPRPLPIHRTEAGYPNCSTCDGGGCLDCTDPA